MIAKVDSRAVKEAEEITGVNGWEMGERSVDEVAGLIDYVDYGYELVKKKGDYLLIKEKIKVWKRRNNYQDKVFIEVLSFGEEVKIKIIIREK